MRKLKVLTDEVRYEAYLSLTSKVHPIECIPGDCREQATRKSDCTTYIIINT